MDELVIDNLVYIPSKKAAAITGYAKDYIGQLCREGRIEAKLVGRSWYVLESSVREHRFGKSGSAPVAEAAPETEAMAEAAPESGPEVPEVTTQEAEVTPEPLSTWESPTYEAEPVSDLIESRHPTSLTSEPEIQEPVEAPVSQVEEVQNAWQEWFSKNEVARTDMQNVAEESLPQEQMEEEAPEIVVLNKREEVVEEEEVVPVRITRTVQGSMDIEPQVERAVPQKEVGRVVRERVVRKQRSKAPSLAYKAVFVGIMIVTAAIAVIGTGSLESISPSWTGASPAIDYLAGVRSVEK